MPSSVGFSPHPCHWRRFIRKHGDVLGILVTELDICMKSNDIDVSTHRRDVPPQLPVLQAGVGELVDRVPH